MTAEVAFRAALIAAGAAGMGFAILSAVRKKITETVSMLWIGFALLSTVSGIFLPFKKWAAGQDASMPVPAVLGGAVLFLAACFVSVRASTFICRGERSQMEAALARFEREEGKRQGSGRPHKELLVIIPAYNEEKSLPEFLLKLKETGIGGIADMLVLDDGSTDRMCRLVREMGCHCVSCAHLGYGRTLQTGYIYALRAGYRYVIQIDADGQHDPCNVRDLYNALRQPGPDGRKPDIVLGSRFLPGGKPFPMPGVKLLTIRLFRLVLGLAAGREITDPTTGLQGLSARAVEYYAGEGNFDRQYPDANMILQMLLRGYQVREIPAVMHARTAGRGMYSGLRPVTYMFHMSISILAVYIREVLARRRPEDERKEL